MTNIPCKSETVLLNSKRLKNGFNHLLIKKGTTSVFACKKANVLIFVISGKIRLLIGKSREYIFDEREMILIKNEGHQLDALQNCKLLILIMDDNWIAFFNSFKQGASKSAHGFVFKIPSLVIHPKLQLFLSSVIESITNKTLIDLKAHSIKQRELESVLKRCYSKKVLLDFFSLLSGQVQDFYQFILDNYKKYPGVEELVQCSKIPQSTFNRKFRELFGESAYQWIIAKRSEIILNKLKENKSPVHKVMDEFYFTDAAHFNHFCKSMFGHSPSEIKRLSKQGLL